MDTTTVPRHSRIPWPLWAAAPVLLLTRLPLLAGNPASLDGDESILGLMALDVLRGEGLPVFFYGQQYGLSTLEAALGALSFGALGISTFALRAAMLVLWVAGGWFVVGTAWRLAGHRGGWVALALLATCPAWSDWSMKARGGYLTAFLLAHAAIWLLAGRRADGGRRAGVWLAVGACLGGVALAQPLWLLCAVPVAAAVWLSRRDPVEIGLSAAAAGTVVVSVLLASRGGADHWSPGLLQGLDPLGGIAALPGRLLAGLGGAYLFEAPLPAGFPTRIAAVGWLLATAAALVAAAWRAPGPPWGRAFGASIAALLLFYLPLGPESGPRYLLPLPAMVILVLALAGGAGDRRRWGAVSLAALTLLGAAASLETVRFRSVPDPEHPYFQTDDELEAVIRTLGADGVRHVYSLDPLLQWNLMFVGHGQVRARWFPPSDRLPALPREVDDARRAGRPVALVGRSTQSDYARQSLLARGIPFAPSPVGNRFFVMRLPGDGAVEALGFQPTVGGGPR